MTARIPTCLLATLIAVACGGRDAFDDGMGPEQFTFDAPWPGDVRSVFTTSFVDGRGDQEALPPEMAGPPYSGPVPFGSVDVTDISLGVQGAFLYMRVDYAAPIPTDLVHIVSAGEVEEQWVRNQGMNIALNADDSMSGVGGEGVHGIDIFFAVSFDFGIASDIYVNWGFPDGDLHNATGHAAGELGQGGPGFDFAVVRYDVSGLGEFFPRGATVDIGSWSEAESFNADGSLKYHHFAFDRVIEEMTWSIPD